MKERIVIKDTEQTFNIVAQFPTQVKPKDFEHTIERVPEKFSELKELCGKFDNVEIGDKHIQFKWHLTLFDSGAVLIDTRVVAFRRTPEQMWVIFKNLMEI